MLDSFYQNNQSKQLKQLKQPKQPTKRFVVKSNTKNPFTYFKVFDINGRIVKEMSVDYQYSFEASSQGIIKGVYFIVTGNAAKSFSSKTVIY